MKTKFIILGSIFSLVIVFFFAIIIKLQVVERNIYKEQVAEIAKKDNVLNSLRGRIFDRNITTPLVYNVSSYQIIVDTQDFESTPSNILTLVDLFNISKKNISDALDNSNKEEIVMKDNLPFDEAVYYIERIKNIEGVSWNRNIKRKYAKNNTLSHVIGYVGNISASELQTYAYGGYYNFDIIGKVGVEKEYETLLRGKAGRAREIINVFGEEIENTQKIVESIEPGKDLILTIDLEMQDIVEKALGERVGAAIVMRPHNGEILAMASYPSYNPNLLVNTLNEKVLSNIQKNTDSPFINRAIQATSSPASTFKIIMASAFLAEDHDNEEGHWHMHINCPGYLKIGNRIFRCWLHAGHGYSNYIRALAESCNVFFYSIGTNILRANTIVNYSARFGLGQLTGIDLPSEVSGILPSPEWKEARYGEPWQDGDTANLSIGQGFLTATPLQMATVASAIVNKGTIYRPHVLKEARDQVTGKVVYTYPVEVVRHIDIGNKVYASIGSAMREVTVSGTSSSVMNTNKVNIAGKTGSGQSASDDFENLHSWYISYGPYDAPVEEQVVVVVWVDASNEWEWWAPKATNIIYEAIFGAQSYEDAIQTLKDRGTWYL